MARTICRFALVNQFSVPAHAVNAIFPKRLDGNPLQTVRINRTGAASCRVTAAVFDFLRAELGQIQTLLAVFAH
jgi:hypothetical protein